MRDGEEFLDGWVGVKRYRMRKKGWMSEGEGVDG